MSAIIQIFVYPHLAAVLHSQGLANQLGQGLNTAASAAGAAAATQPAGVKPDDVMSTLERLGEMKAKGILTQEEFDAKKAELLKKLV